MAKVARAPDKIFVVDIEYEGERGHGLLYRPGSSVNGISLPEVLYMEGGGEGRGGEPVFGLREI